MGPPMNTPKSHIITPGSPVKTSLSHIITLGPPGNASLSHIIVLEPSMNTPLSLCNSIFFLVLQELALAVLVVLFHLMSLLHQLQQLSLEMVSKSKVEAYFNYFKEN